MSLARSLPGAPARSACTAAAGWGAAQACVCEALQATTLKKSQSPPLLPSSAAAMARTSRSLSLSLFLSLLPFLFFLPFCPLSNLSRSFSRFLLSLAPFRPSHGHAEKETASEREREAFLQATKTIHHHVCVQSRRHNYLQRKSAGICNTRKPCLVR